MADLRRDGRQLFGGDAEREVSRGQVMLIAGFVLAVAFLAVAVMLNAVIYSENLATRGEDARGSEAIAYRADVVDGAEQLIEYVNVEYASGSGTPFENRTAEFNRSVRSMYNSTALMQSTDGIATDVTVIGVTQGTFIGQFNASRNFTSANGIEDWELANDTYGTRAFRINITEPGADDFVVSVTNGSDTWSAEIDGNSTNTTIDIDGAGSCTVGPTPEIDLTAGTVDGSPCEALSFGENVSAPYSIKFEDANEVVGNFSLVVNSTSYDATNYDSERDSPFADDEAVYAATLYLRHESPDHVYATEASVVPGENDA
ncbi:DUF7261 family protein [Halapricum hydrolyticum]|uniref:Uncharacterized protein n=1 Tax=Halapricum hydrolyticum TaxID=2979991 RepID=A0AAE3I9G1_9EURY|nr:hypothetical protein [Halapricum hydrolyticum]MCU4716613.1 hypothetical protein [Halapricum hydrolyticum]MCU4725782.1 hypothetical protein [Halapricum hydrolyticum]